MQRPQFGLSHFVSFGVLFDVNFALVSKRLRLYIYIYIYITIGVVSFRMSCFALYAYFSIPICCEMKDVRNRCVGS